MIRPVLAAALMTILTFSAPGAAVSASVSKGTAEDPGGQGPGSSTATKPDADAAIILEESTLDVQRKDKAFLEYHIVKKILRTRRSSEGVFRFPDNRWQKVESISAVAIHPDGLTETAGKDDIPVVPDFSDYVMYSDQRSRVVGFKGTKRGSLLDVRVRWRIDNPVYWPEASFQGELPILERSFTLISEEGLPVTVTALNMEGEPDTSFSEGSRTTRKWKALDIEAFEPEQKMPPAPLYLPALVISPGWTVELGQELDLSSWEGIARWYASLVEDRMEGGPWAHEILGDIGAAGIGPAATAEAIYRYVAGRVRYVAIYLGLGGFQPHKAEETARMLYGDCKDQSTLLTVLLREAGIEAYPVLVRTSDRGRLEGIPPFPGYFNHVITAAVVRGKTVYLDPTCGVCSYGSTPSGIKGAHALAVRYQGGGLFTLPESGASGDRLETETRIELDEAHTARVTDRITCTGSYAEIFRSVLESSSGKDAGARARAFIPRDNPSLSVESMTVTGEDAGARSMAVEIDYTVPDYCPDRSKIFLDVRPHRLNLGMPVCRERRYPVDLGSPRTFINRTELVLPPSLEIEAHPDSLKIFNEFFDYAGVWRVEGRAVRSKTAFRLKSGSVPAEMAGKISEDVKKIEEFERAGLLLSRKGSR